MKYKVTSVLLIAVLILITIPTNKTNATVIGTNLTAKYGTLGGTSTTTASISPQANALILLSVTTRTAAGDPNIPTVTGNGLTWVVATSTNYDNSGSQKRITTFRAMGNNPTTGVATIDFAGQTQSDIHYAVDQFRGIDTSGSNGSGAIVQVSTNRALGGANTTITATLNAFANANNATFGAIAFGNGTGSGTVGGGFTQLSNKASGGNLLMMTEYTTANDTTVDGSTSAAGEAGATAAELKIEVPVAKVGEFNCVSSCNFKNNINIK